MNPIAPLLPEEKKMFRRRITVIGMVITILFSLLASRLYFLQINDGDKYSQLSKGNRIRLVPLAAPRGVIYDRNGIVLAGNRPSYQLQLVREDTPDLEFTLQNLSKTLKIPYSSLQKTIEKKRSVAAFKPIVLIDDLDFKKVALIETFQEDFPGVSIVVESRRFYPNHKVAAHVLGYVGVRSEKQKKKLTKDKNRSGLIIGQAGVELLHNQNLIGSDGGKQIEVDHVGRELEVLSNPVTPIPGNDVYLTIDVQLQQYIHEIMRGKSGAVMVTNPKTGEILSMASFPSYNPNLFSAGISSRSWKRLLNNPENPLENKTIQGIYPPGSTFKMVTAYAGLEEGIIDNETEYMCNGYYYLKGRSTPYKCWRWKFGGHGIVDLSKAIEGSCNVYFYHIAEELGVDKIHDIAKRFGLGKTVGIGLKNEKAGNIPSSEWKQKTFGEPWYRGETPPVSIGQGFVTTTPLQVINFINIIATLGEYVPPHLIASEQPPTPQSLELDKKYLSWIRDGMVAAVNEKRGTARKVRVKDIPIAGKTGTAQVVGHKTLANLTDKEKEDKSLQNHAWLAAFGPAYDPEISVVVLVEHGGGGSTAAGPIAKQILDFYFENYYEFSQTEEMIPESYRFVNDLQNAFNSPSNIP